MEFEAGISLYEKIEIQTSEEILPVELANLIDCTARLYDIYLFYFATQPVDERSSDLIWSKEFIDARRAAYPDYESHVEVDKFQEQAGNILYVFNEAREKVHYEDILEAIPKRLKLRISKITTNSPVKIELLGIGEIIKQFKDFVLALVNLSLDRKDKKQGIRKKELENFEKILELSVKYKLTPEMIGKLSYDYANASNTLNKMLSENKIETLKIEEDGM